MKILLTNDDGIESEGLQRLRSKLDGYGHEVWVIAPQSNRSGSSHSVTLDGPSRIRELEERQYSCTGTPADCVMIACLGLFPISFDTIISGINLGPNLGTDIIYSGTAAAARQGALMGRPSIAASLNTFSPPFRLDYPIEFLCRNLDLLRKLWEEDHFVNINFPNLENGKPEPQVTFPTRRVYKDELIQFTGPNGDLFCFLDGAIPESQMEKGSDFWCLKQGGISISPVLIHPTNHDIEEHYRRASFWYG